MKRNYGFSLLELLVSITILGVVGTVVLTALWLFLGTFHKSDDYMSADQNAEFAFSRLSSQLGNAGLGLPSNETPVAGFSTSFSGLGSRSPLMANMGESTKTWGGSITLGQSGAHKDVANVAKKERTLKSTIAGNVYIGEELFYTWGVPTGARLLSYAIDSRDSDTSASVARPNVSKDLSSKFNWPVALTFSSTDLKRMVDFHYDGRAIGVSSDTLGLSTRSWVVFPMLKIPLLVNTINATGGSLDVRVAASPPTAVELEGLLNFYEEAHLVQTVGVFVDDLHRLIQRSYDTPTIFHDEILATNVAAVSFIFAPEPRTLTMYVAMRGDAVDHTAKGGYSDFYRIWAALASDNLIKTPTAEDRRYQILFKSMTWRINK